MKILVRRWPRFAELESQTRSGGAEACVAHWSLRDWRDLQVLSQLAWMDEEYLANASCGPRRAFRKRGKFHRRRQDGAARKAARTALQCVDTISNASVERPDRKLNDALLPSGSCRCCAIPISLAWPTQHTLSASTPVLGIPRMRENNWCGRGRFHERIFGKTSGGAVAVRGLGFRPGT